jgi:OmpA-OmpF porin, OOP family
MKQILALSLSSLFVLCTYASETPTEITPLPFIKPVAIEEAPSTVIVELDSDNDGVLDKDDKCPDTPHGKSVDKDGCVLLNDADNDGVADEVDQCPNTASGIKVNEKGCELDSDGDGIPDSRDKCPDTSKDFVVDGYGCPQTANLKIQFESGKSDVNDALILQLETFALFLKENKGYQVVIYGYTDNIGNPEANKLLSQKRANAVKEGLIRYQISETRLTSIGMGDKNPVAENTTPQGRAANRRIEVELIQ